MKRIMMSQGNRYAKQRVKSEGAALGKRVATAQAKAVGRSG